ncbi:MAG TPA: transposase [Gammaproteobacteria bacterium]|nr:transposase [Gammaproteobacteria bacterium]
MARQKRICIPGIPFHVTQRGSHGATTFFAREDFELYLRLLAIATNRFGAELHAYVLMTNHVHLLITPRHSDSLSRTMQYAAGVYSRQVNERLGRTGAVWGSRFWSAPIEADGYCLACYRYIELNPVRARMVTSPASYPWSSYGANGLGTSSTLIVPQATYLALGSTVTARSAAYRRLFEVPLSESVLDDIRNGTRRGLPTGSLRFRERFEASKRNEEGGEASGTTGV